jgi:tetratricopeptide (TPR) repeat protein
MKNRQSHARMKFLLSAMAGGLLFAAPANAQTTATPLPIPPRNGVLNAAPSAAEQPPELRNGPPATTGVRARPSQSGRTATASSVSATTELQDIHSKAIASDVTSASETDLNRYDEAYRQSEKALRYEELRKKIAEILKRQRELPPRPTPDQSNSPPPELDTTETQTPAEPAAPDWDNDSGTSAAAADVAAAVNALTATESTDGEDIQTLNLPPIIGGPIDRIALADNLFALGENLIALEMYSQVNVEFLSTADKVWVEYQSAGCLRRLNRIPEAQERYRRLVAQQDEKWLSDLSRWWLNRIDDREEAVQELANYQRLLTALKESLDGIADE